VDRSSDLAASQAPGSDSLEPVRRAPFGGNPVVGARGLRTQQRVLDGALQSFAEVGYSRTTMERIAQLTGCSRASIYQYYASKDELFRHLAAQVARQLRASLDALTPISANAAGRASLLRWVGRYADIWERYAPMFRAFEIAAASDSRLAEGAVGVGRRNVRLFEARVESADVDARLLDPTVELILVGVNRALDLSSMLRAAAPAAYGRERVDSVIADVVHRILFGLVPDVNIHPPAPDRPPNLRMGPGMTAMFERVQAFETEALEPGRQALAALLAAGPTVVAERGYLGVRAAHLAKAAGVSRASVYTYFDDVDEFMRVVAARAVRDVAEVVDDFPVPSATAELYDWLRAYGTVHSAQAPLIRVWMEAVEQPWGDERAGVFDWGRRRMAEALSTRGFGDPGVEGVVMLAMVEAFGSIPQGTAELHAAVRLIENGFLDGQDR
jgi:AcrR family transcriptional regulator